jgi:uncharacterized membrane protein YoaT (DUF817 family)
MVTGHLIGPATPLVVPIVSGFQTVLNVLALVLMLFAEALVTAKPSAATATMPASISRILLSMCNPP